MTPGSRLPEDRHIPGTLYTTDSVPVGKRPAYWREALSRTFSAVNIVVPDDVYSGIIRTSQLGSLRVATVECDGLHCVRNSRLIARGNSEDVIVRLQGRGIARLEQGTREVYLHPGEIVLYDMTRPHRMDFPEPHQTKSLVLPRRLLGLNESDLQRITATPIRPDTAMGALLSPFLSRLVDTAQTYPSHTGELLARNTVDLLTALADERLGRRAGETPGADRALLVRIQAFIVRHLADPDLTPEAIARTHHISERYLHKLFEQADVTVSRWIQRRRLEECQRELACPGALILTVAAVARRWGFASAAHFSRVFRAVYGMSPSEWRDTGSVSGVSKSRPEPLDGHPGAPQRQGSSLELPGTTPPDRPVHLPKVVLSRGQA